MEENRDTYIEIILNIRYNRIFDVLQLELSLLWNVKI